jgi:hypothetical protein
MTKKQAQTPTQNHKQAAEKSSKTTKNCTTKEEKRKAAR